MNLQHKKVDPTNPDFISLEKELNLSLTEITDDSGESSFSPEAFDPALDGCIVVYSNQDPVACGVFRHIDNEVCELKRMYSSVSGAGTYLLKQLELYAIDKGYRKAVLSTRRINSKAVDFYARHSYMEISAYGTYVGVERSICLSKTLIS